MKLAKIKVRAICSSKGFVAPGAVCGSVSVWSDEKGQHRCMAHGNTKCEFKKEQAK